MHNLQNCSLNTHKCWQIVAEISSNSADLLRRSTTQFEDEVPQKVGLPNFSELSRVYFFHRGQYTQLRYQQIRLRCSCSPRRQQCAKLMGGLHRLSSSIPAGPACPPELTVEFLYRSHLARPNRAASLNPRLAHEWCGACLPAFAR